MSTTSKCTCYCHEPAFANGVWFEMLCEQQPVCCMKAHELIWGKSYDRDL